MNKYKKLLGNTAIFGIGSFLSKIIGFFLTALYTHNMSEGEFSTAELIYSTVNMLVPVVTFSMADAVIRFGMDKAYDRRKVFTAANAALLMGMTLFMLFTPLVSTNVRIGKYSFVLYLYCFFCCFRQIASQYVRARGYVKLFMADGVVAVFNQLILNLILIVGFKLGVTGYVLSFVISDCISIVWLTLLARLDKCIDTRFSDIDLFKEMLKFSAPLIPTYVLWWVTSASDRWFVVEMVGETENGIYSIGYKLPNLILLVTTMFYQAWQMSSIEERDSKDLGKFYQNVFGAYSSVLFIAAAGLIMLVKPLTMVLTGDGSNGTHFYEAYLFTPILIISMLFQCCCQFLSSIYSTRKRSLNSLFTALVAAVTNVVLNLILIKKHGMWGAAIATACSYFACFAVRLFDARRLIYFRVNYIRLIVNTLIVVIMAILVGTEAKLWVLWVILLFLICCIYNLGALYKTIKRILYKKGGKPRISANA